MTNIKNVLKMNERELELGAPGTQTPCHMEYRDIAWIFILQGGMIGIVGVAFGCALGILGSLAVPTLVAWIEQLIGMRFLNTDVYPVSFLPVDLLLSDIGLVAVVAFGMCLVAAIYPARRAASLAPAQVLNQDR